MRYARAHSAKLQRHRVSVPYTIQAHLIHAARLYESGHTSPVRPVDSPAGWILTQAPVAPRRYDASASTTYRRGMPRTVRRPSTP